MRELLSAGAGDLGLMLGDEALERFTDYLDLLGKWNRTYNLTAVRNVRDMAVLHLLDSMAVHPYLVGCRLADAGSGAGLPGIPLAILDRDRQWTLLESSGKKARFLRQAVLQLGLANVDVVDERVERYPGSGRFDGVVSRAFTSLAGFVNLAGHLAGVGGRLYAMKGKYPAAEIEALTGEFRVEEVHRLEVPFLEAERHLVVMRADTPGDTG